MRWRFSQNIGWGMDEQARPDTTGFRVNHRILAQVPDGEEHREVADQRFVIRRSRVQLPPPAPELADLHRVCLSSMPIGDVDIAPAVSLLRAASATPGVVSHAHARAPAAKNGHTADSNCRLRIGVLTLATSDRYRKSVSTLQNVRLLSAWRAT